MKRIHIIYIGVIAILLSACGESGSKKNSKSKQKEKKEVFVPAFNADSAFYYVKKQVDFGPRVPGTEAHQQCADYLVATLERFAPEVMVQDFTMQTYDGVNRAGKNIIASFKPESNNRILLCAHWDTRHMADHDQDQANHNTPIDGANDGASGVGVLLEIARQLSQHPVSPGIDIIFFDLEDFGQPQGVQNDQEDTWALGSQWWSLNPHKPGYRARYGILLDMVGHEHALFTQEAVSVYYAQHILDKVWVAAGKAGYGSYFMFQKSGVVLDDHLYINRNANIPTIDIIDYDDTREKGFFEHWHTVNDKLEYIHPGTLKAVGQTVLTVLYHER